jgi:hypothetical protein
MSTIGNPIVITIAKTKEGLYSFSVQDEENRDRDGVREVFDLVEPVLRKHYQPVRTFFKPIKKARRS